jgi:hypothetical protein
MAAAISIGREPCASFAMEGKVPRSVIVVTAESVYTRCPKALVRSRLWDARLPVDESTLPSSGTIMKSMQRGFDGETFDRHYPAAIQGNNLLNRRARANTVRQASLPLLAQMRSADWVRKCLLFGVDRTYRGHHETDANDPKRRMADPLSLESKRTITAAIAGRRKDSNCLCCIKPKDEN